METIEKDFLESYVQAAGFENIEAFAYERLLKRLEANLTNRYLLSSQVTDIQGFIQNLEASTATGVALWLQTFDYDFFRFVSEELVLFYQENIQNFRWQIMFFQKKYALQNWKELVEQYHSITQIPENEKDSDEIVWENIQNLYEDFIERLNDLQYGIQTGNRTFA